MEDKGGELLTITGSLQSKVGVVNELVYIHLVVFDGDGEEFRVRVDWGEESIS